MTINDFSVARQLRDNATRATPVACRSTRDCRVSRKLSRDGKTTQTQVVRDVFPLSRDSRGCETAVLQIDKAGRWRHVFWTHDLMAGYLLVDAALDRAVLGDRLMEIFQANRGRLLRRSELAPGSPGYWLFLPPDLVDAVCDIVKDCFADAAHHAHSGPLGRNDA